MQSIDEDRLEQDAEYRFDYVARFIDFDDDDARAIRDVAPLLLPRLEPVMVEIYDRFHDFDATWRHFTVVPTACPMAAAARRRMEDLTTDHGTIQFRKHKLTKYFRYILARPLDRLTVRHFDQMARRHRGASDFASMRIPLVQMNAFMAFIADRVTRVIMDIGLERAREVAALRAVQKLIWLQTDLITRHYQAPALMEGV